MSDILEEDLALEAANAALDDDGKDLDIVLNPNLLTDRETLTLNRLLWYQPDNETQVARLTHEGADTNKWTFDQEHNKVVIDGESSEMTGACIWTKYCFEHAGQYDTENPFVGDAVFFDHEQDGHVDHIGVISRIEDDKIYVLEGNATFDEHMISADESQYADTTEGYLVAEKAYPVDFKEISGFGHLNYNGAAKKYSELTGMEMKGSDFRKAYLENMRSECGYMEHNSYQPVDEPVQVSDLNFENYTKYHDVVGAYQHSPWCNYFVEAESKLTFQKMNQEQVLEKQQELNEGWMKSSEPVSKSDDSIVIPTLPPAPEASEAADKSSSIKIPDYISKDRGAEAEQRFGKTLETMASIDNVFGDFGG